ncbi:MAG: metallophosphoesterase family protein [Anaerolineae bacterium]
MRILLFSDIHGNAVALEAVLTDSVRHGPYDLTLCLGDLAWAGPRSAEVLARLRELCREDPSGKVAPAICLYGNCDRFLLDEMIAPPGKERERFLRHREWMLAQLSPVDLAFLRQMPFSHRVAPLPGHELLAVHANPRNVNDPIQPDLSDAAIDAVLGPAEFQVLAFGHVHIPSVRLWRGRLLVNAASVGLPMDSDQRAAYSVLSWAGGGWRAAQYRVEYDVQRVARDMERNGLPRGRHFAERLLRARYV